MHFHKAVIFVTRIILSFTCEHGNFPPLSSYAFPQSGSIIFIYCEFLSNKFLTNSINAKCHAYIDQNFTLYF